jgi:hypothetical protein
MSTSRKIPPAEITDVWLAAFHETDGGLSLEFDPADPPVAASGESLVLRWDPGGLAVVTIEQTGGRA